MSLDLNVPSADQPLGRPLRRSSRAARKMSQISVRNLRVARRAIRPVVDREQDQEIQFRQVAVRDVIPARFKQFHLCAGG
jgi:hypothetical protein